MNVLAVNCGSSSLKFALFESAGTELGANHRLAEGVVELHRDRSRLRFVTKSDARLDQDGDPLDHGAAAIRVVRWLRSQDLAPDAIGHRVVHGGTRFAEAVRLDQAVLDTLDALTRLAPLHNGPALAAVRALREELGDALPMTASFDTAFHRTMPQRAARYPIPLDLADRHGLWRFGFHGLAHLALARGAAALLQRPLEELRLVTLQLGGGASAAAIDGGRSLDTSMGLTPLEGLMMGTRSGDVDPSLAAAIAAAETTTVEDAVELLNRRSGLLGVSGRSADVRELLTAEAEGDERAALALEMFCYRVRKQIGAYLAVLEGAEAIVFGGGIGEHSSELRSRICEPLAWAGLRFDPTRNETLDDADGEISAAGSTLRALVVHVREEELIAADCRAVLAAGG